jgi:hypothetical protein
MYCAKVFLVEFRIYHFLRCEMKIETVHTNLQNTLFLDLPRKLYAKEPEWVCPLDNDINEIFSIEHNSAFQNGNAIRWILLDEQEQIIGRIAAFYSDFHQTNQQNKTGGIGFFECIENEKAAFLLFDTAKDWLKKQGCSAIDGPINFGEKDKFWGLMVKGFKNPSYQENFNFPYYEKFFLAYGFKLHTEQTTSEIRYSDFNRERFEKLATRVFQNSNYHYAHFKISELEKFASDFIHIYNLAWANRPDFVPMTKNRIETTLRSLKPILMEEAIWFVYANDEPAGFYVNVIDVNQIFKHVNGKLNWIGKLKFIWYKYFGTINRLRGIVFGVIPAYQNLGLETGLIMKFYEAIQKKPQFVSAELAWIGDFNPKMHALFKALGAQTTKVHHTYKIEI